MNYLGLALKLIREECPESKRPLTWLEANYPDCFKAVARLFDSCVMRAWEMNRLEIWKVRQLFDGLTVSGLKLRYTEMWTGEYEFPSYIRLTLNLASRRCSVCRRGFKWRGRVSRFHGRVVRNLPARTFATALRARFFGGGFSDGSLVEMDRELRRLCGSLS